MRASSIQAADCGRPATVRLADGGEIAARRGVVVATDGPAAAALLGSALADSPSKTEQGVGTACVYFRCALEPLLLTMFGTMAACVSPGARASPPLVYIQACTQALALGQVLFRHLVVAGPSCRRTWGATACMGRVWASCATSTMPASHVRGASGNHRRARGVNPLCGLLYVCRNGGGPRLSGVRS